MLNGAPGSWPRRVAAAECELTLAKEISLAWKIGHHLGLTRTVWRCLAMDVGFQGGFCFGYLKTRGRCGVIAILK